MAKRKISRRERELEEDMDHLERRVTELTREKISLAQANEDLHKNIAKLIEREKYLVVEFKTSQTIFHQIFDRLAGIKSEVKP